MNKSLLAIFTILLLTLRVTSYAQSKWEAVENSLDIELKNKSITTKEWYERLLKEAGFLGPERKVWYKYDDLINTNSEEYKAVSGKKGLILYIPRDWNITRENGNAYIKTYLFNLSDSTIRILRIDSTIDGFKDYIKINGKWVELQSDYNSSVECGNGSFTSKLDGRSFYHLQIGSPNQPRGTEKLSYKAVLTINGETIESNEIKINLYKNQLARLVY